MANINKNAIVSIFDTYFAKNTDIFIEKNEKNILASIKELTDYVENEGKIAFSIEKKILEEELKKYEKEYEKVQEDVKKGSGGSYISSVLSYKNKTEFAKSRAFRIDLGNYTKEKKIKYYLIEKYKPTVEISKLVLFFKLNLNEKIRTDIMFCIFFNEKNEFTLDLILENKQYYQGDVEKDLKIISTKTNLEITMNFIKKLKEKIEKESNIKIKNNKVKDFIHNGAIATIKEIFDNLNIKYKVKETYTNFDLTFNTKKGDILIKIPKKDIKDNMKILPELVNLLIKSNELKIKCISK